MTLPYLALLIALPGPAMRIFYGADSQFRDPQGLLALRLFALGFVLFIVMSLIGSLLNGVGRTRDSFHAQVVNARSERDGGVVGLTFVHLEGQQKADLFRHLYAPIDAAGAERKVA